MKLLSFISTLSAVIYLSVGLNTYHLNKKSREGFVFLLFTIILSIWSYTSSFVYTAENIYEYSLWNKISAIGWCFFPAMVLLFALIITKHPIQNSNKSIILLFTPAFLLLLMAVFLFGPNMNTSPIIANVFYISDFLYNNIYIILGIIMVCIWRKNSNNLYQKKQGKIVVITSVISFTLNLITQTILPFAGIKGIPNVSQIYSLIMLFGMQYAIVHYNFLLASNSRITDELFHEIMDLTFVIDLDGKIFRTNKQVNQLLYYNEEELVNKPLSDFIKEKRLMQHIENRESVVSPIKLNNINLFTKNGELIPVNITISPIRDSKNNIPLGLLIVGQDIRIINSLRDEICNHKETSEKLKISEELFRTVAETIPYAVILTKRSDNRILYSNKMTGELLHCDTNQLQEALSFSFYQNIDDRYKLIKDMEEGRTIKERELIFKKFDNTFFPGLITMVPTLYNGEEVMLSCVMDLTEKRVMEQSIIKSEEMFRKLMDSIPDLVLVCDLEGNITFANRSIKNILGYDPKWDKLPDNLFSFLMESDRELAKETMKKSIEEDIGPIVCKHLKKDGSLIDVELHGTVLREDNREPFGFIYVTRDITERIKAQEVLKKSKEEIEKINKELIKSNQLLHEKSIRDSLTNLYNHQYIINLLENEIPVAKQQGSDLCLMMMDIDLFKQINDNYGHQTGDKVIDNVAKIIQLNVRDHDYVGRYGGEEFLIVLPRIDLQGAYEIAYNIRTSIQNYVFTRRKISITVSIGVASLRDEDAKAFINRADRNLYSAKSSGRNQIVY